MSAPQVTSGPVVLRPAIAAEPAGVPALLRERPRWICWRLAPGTPKPRKLPLAPRTGEVADAHDPIVWTDFATACRRAGEIQGCAGLGYVFVEGDGLVGIDLDDCVDEQGRPTPEAMDIVRRFGTYAEISPSGTGVKLFLIAAKAAGAGCTSTALPG